VNRQVDLLSHAYFLVGQSHNEKRAGRISCIVRPRLISITLLAIEWLPGKRSPSSEARANPGSSLTISSILLALHRLSSKLGSPKPPPIVRRKSNCQSAPGSFRRSSGGFCNQEAWKRQFRLTLLSPHPLLASARGTARPRLGRGSSKKESRPIVTFIFQPPRIIGKPGHTVSLLPLR